MIKIKDLLHYCYLIARIPLTLVQYYIFPKSFEYFIMRQWNRDGSIDKLNEDWQKLVDSGQIVENKLNSSVTVITFNDVY